MSSRRSVVAVASILLFAGPATAAEPDVTITFTAADKCTVSGKGIPSHKATLDVQLELPAAASEVKLFDEKAQGSGKTFDLTIKSTDAPQGAPAGKLNVAAKPVSYVCDTEKVLFSSDAGGAPANKPLDTNPNAAEDKRAQDWWTGDDGKKGVAEIERVRLLGKPLGLPRDTVFVVHKPSGNLVFPSRTAITEGTPVQVAILLPEGDSRSLPAIHFDDCDAPDPQRVVPSEAKQAAKATFALQMLGPWRTCGSGKLTYHLSLTNKDRTDKIETTLRIRPKYHFAGIALLGYDWAKRVGFEKATDPTGTMTTIAEVDARVGAIAYVGAQWMIGGVDYEAMQPWNYFANLFLAVNVASPLNDAVVGLALTPTGGASLAVGATFHSGKRLTNGATVGQTFTGNGDVPTADTWNGVKPGFFLGLAIDSRVADALGSRFKGGTSDDQAKDSSSSTDKSADGANTN